MTALVSLHLVQPWVSAPILVRLADTLVGAAIAHLFNYFWPRWESSEAPRLVSRLEAQLAAFAAAALRADVSDHDYRLARKNVIEAIAALSDSAGRMSIEPMAARKGLDEMAGLSDRRLWPRSRALGRPSRRSDRRSPSRTRRSAAGLRRCSLANPSRGGEAPAGPLAAAALAVTAAARKYERVAKSEAN